MVHGGIDGFSRVVTYLQAATNNTAQTVFLGVLHLMAYLHVFAQIKEVKIL